MGRFARKNEPSSFYLDLVEATRKREAEERRRYWAAKRQKQLRENPGYGRGKIFLSNGDCYAKKFASNRPTPHVAVSDLSDSEEKMDMDEYESENEACESDAEESQQNEEDEAEEEEESHENEDESNTNDDDEEEEDLEKDKKDDDESDKEDNDEGEESEDDDQTEEKDEETDEEADGGEDTEKVDGENSVEDMSVLVNGNTCEDVVIDLTGIDTSQESPIDTSTEDPMSFWPSLSTLDEETTHSSPASHSTPKRTEVSTQTTEKPKTPPTGRVLADTRFLDGPCEHNLPKVKFNGAEFENMVMNVQDKRLIDQHILNIVEHESALFDEGRDQPPPPPPPEPLQKIELDRAELVMIIRRSILSLSGIRPTMGKTPLGLFLQSFSRHIDEFEIRDVCKPSNLELCQNPESVKSTSDFCAFDYGPDKVASSPYVVKWDDTGAFFPIWEQLVCGTFVIRDLRVWVKSNKKWKLRSLLEDKFDRPMRLVRAFNRKPLHVYPWPTTRGDKFKYGRQRGTLLLALGFSPCLVTPPYAADARFFSSVFTTIGVQRESTQGPTENQLSQAYSKIERTVMRMLILYSQHAFLPNGEEDADAQLRTMLTIFRRSFGEEAEDSGEHVPIDLKDVSSAMKESMGEIFKRINFVPGGRLMKMYYHALCQVKFTENETLMSLFGCRYIPARLVRRNSLSAIDLPDVVTCSPEMTEALRKFWIQANSVKSFAAETEDA
ncbi:Oidioi.mRNA.OKI2018_I69.chr1.g2766.t1.cds [Oikopleura dioica]|uniref:Oidioi.mRNA.OKI2018_I69.chr1.g2766.t1.cds n=1 Tax=Oikopleura dioica TaxID=34765 RepID=A0ABN7SS53_OIKDI|nr:Oidioi.mRNA.OKI2018_I69.chr1.g2766.t1.cds [Oikopleura dioica]